MVKTVVDRGGMRQTEGYDLFHIMLMFEINPLIMLQRF